MLRRVAIAQMLALAFVSADDQVDSRLVDLNVIAVDSRGQPVTDLTREEFQVADAGKRQQIAFFRHNDGKLPQVPTLGPGEYSNGGRVNSPHVTLVLFDLLNQRFDTRALTANRIVQELGDVEAADDLYLYMLTLEGRLFAVHGITGAEGVEQSPVLWTRRIKPLMDEAMRTVPSQRPIDSDVYLRVQYTFAALESIAAQLARFPGRKNIVWLTDGVPASLGPASSGTGDFVDFTPQLRQLSEWFERSGVAIYPVRQVMLGSPDAMGSGSSMGSIESLDLLAGLTGGRPTGSKDTGAAVRQAMSDLRSSYQIGYYPPPQNWDGKFHNLRVTCTRKGVRIQARTGYYAWPESPGARADRAIGAEVPANFDAAGIGLRGMVTPDPNNPHHVHVALRIAANDVALAQDGDWYVGHLRLACARYPSNGRATGSAIVPLDLRYSAVQREKVLQDGIDFNQDLTLEADVSRIRLIVFDRGSDTVGSLTIPVGAAAHTQ